MEDLARVDQCKAEVIASDHRREEIPGIVDDLVLSCGTGDCFDHISPEPIPSREATISVIEKARRILYPGYFIRSRVDNINLSYYFGQEATALFEALTEQITLSIRHECLRYSQPCTHCEAERTGDGDRLHAPSPPFAEHACHGCACSLPGRSRGQRLR